jgi:hypothetical protein
VTGSVTPLLFSGAIAYYTRFLYRIALPLLLMAFIVSKIAGYLGAKGTPAFLLTMEEQLPTTPAIVARVGAHTSFKDTYNENDLLKDTLRYTFSLAGSKATMHIKGYALKQQGEWIPAKSDTLFTP